jgi:hypothetical protein
MTPAERKAHRLPAAIAASLGAAAALATATPVLANDFPTQARVEFVLQCIKDNGGESYKNVYGCICMIDEIAERMSYEAYIEATTFSALRTVPGERSGLFRDNDRGRALEKSTDEVRSAAAGACLMPSPE